MKDIFWFFMVAFVFFLMWFGASIGAHAAGGAGGSWDNDSGFGGNGGSMGGSGGGGSWTPQVCTFNGYSSFIEAANANCASMGKGTHSSSFFNSFGGKVPTKHGEYTTNWCTGGNNVGGGIYLSCSDNPEPEPPPCPTGMHYEGSVCVKDLKCPAGYVKDGNKCIWQCPAGYKMMGGNCVKDDMPEDCDPAIQQCDEDGKPVCDCCANLTQLVNLTNTSINNDNRIISLTETTVSNQNTIINNTENINNNISTVNTNITTTNNKLDQLIQTINENKPDFDTSALEAKLDQLIAKDWSVGDVSLDLDKTNALLAQIDASVKANKYDDTELKAKLDELINKDLSEVTSRQDEQTGLLEQIRDLLRPVKEGELAPSLENVAFEARLDPWSAIRGFDVNQNMINARAQCPLGDAYSFNFFGHHFAMPMSILCGYLAQLGVGFMFLAYMGGAFIIVKGD